MPSSSSAPDMQSNQQKYVRVLANNYFNLGSCFVQDDSLNVAIGCFFEGFSLYLLHPYTLNATERENLDVAQNNFSTLLRDNTLTTQSSFLGDVKEHYLNFLHGLPYINLIMPTADYPLLKKNINSEVRTILANLWNSLGTQLLADNQLENSSNCFEFACQQAKEIENFPPEQLAQFHRDSAYSLYNAGIRYPGSINDSVIITNKGLSYLLTIPKQYKTAHDYETCLQVQSQLVTGILGSVLRYIINIQDPAVIQKGAEYFEVANREHSKFMHIVEILQYDSPNPIKVSLQKIKISHQQEYFDLLHRLFIGSNHLNAEYKISFANRLLHAYREIPAEHKTTGDSNSHKVAEIQKTLIKECTDHINRLILTKSFENLKTAYNNMEIILNEYELTDNDSKQTLLWKENYLGALRKYILLILVMVKFSPDPYDDKYIQFVDEAIEINDQLTPYLTDADRTDKEKKSYYQFLRRFATLLGQYAEGLYRTTDAREDAIHYHEIIVAALLNIPLDQQSPFDTVKLNSHRETALMLRSIPNATPPSVMMIFSDNFDLAALHTEGLFALDSASSSTIIEPVQGRSITNNPYR